MATAAVTPDQDAIVAELFIAAPPERVFKAITDPSQTAMVGTKGHVSNYERALRRASWGKMAQ
jgi:uncharacterized protein YndB with AHSA1/START domain